MKRLLSILGLLIMYHITCAQTTIVNDLQVNTTKGTPPSTAMPANGGLAYLDVNGKLKKSTTLALIGSKISAITATNDSTLHIVSDGGTSDVLVRGLFTLSRQRWFDSVRNGLIFDTLHITQIGAGINLVYSDATGKILYDKGLQGSTTIGITRNADSSLTFNSLLAFSSSVTITGGVNVRLVGDVLTPADGSAYGEIGGSKGWFPISQFPVVNPTTNGIMIASDKARLDSSVTFVNYTVGGTFDSIVVASPTLDSVIFKGQRFSGGSGSGLVVTNVGNVFDNDYVFSFGSTSIGGGSIGSITKSGDGTTIVFTSPHGLSGVTSTSFIVLTARSSGASTYAPSVTLDATNITITYPVANPPPSGTNNLVWSYIIKP